MSSIQIRTEIGKLLPIADDRLLAAIYALMKSYLEHNDEDIVGFTTEGEPLTKKSLLDLVEKSRQAGLIGNVKTSEAVLQAIENW